MVSTLNPPLAPSWNHTPEEIATGIDDHIKSRKALRDEIAATPNPSFDNVIKKMVYSDQARAGLVSQLLFYHNVSANKDVRDSSSKAEAVYRDFAIEMSMREDMYKVVDAVKKQSPELKPESQRLLDKIHLDYVRDGLALPPEQREKLKDLNKQLSALELEYRSNLGENTEHVWFTEQELDGVPEGVVSQFEQDIDSGKRKMTFKYPDVVPVMKYAKLAETRRRAFVGDQNKALANCDLLGKAVKLRAEIAALLGYKTHAAYVLEERMAKTPEKAFDFLNDLRNKLSDAGKAEIDHLKELKKAELKSKGLPIDDSINVWDYRYYDNRLLESEYDIDSEKISEYFPIETTIARMLGIFEELFGLQFAEASEDQRSVWHADCKQFAVWRPESSEFVGWLYFDLHPREGKYGHAANFNIWAGYTDEQGARRYPVTALVCNFSKPTPTKPSLLKHNEVVTLFHELGHGIHNLVSVTEYSRFHGTRVSRDFVEAPSQMLEFWCWEPKELKRLSGHYIDGESISDDLISKIVKSKHVNGGLFNLRQLHFALFDLTLHTSDGSINIADAWNSMRQDISLLDQGSEITHGYASFGHLMGGYDAGYYGYLWSEVFAADIFYTKFKADAMNQVSGKEYQLAILKPGGSRDEMESLKILLGREPSNSAFLQELGIQNHSARSV
ncbi:uncharacterized protein V1516DRAFT_670319 [Lipomyces oligophaga]|uniref:uncharacterized protein n=1 Tax=Lipomyces oligophaga TaxID=45792 RepID=UPI0034CF7299